MFERESWFRELVLQLLLENLLEQYPLKDAKNSLNIVVLFVSKGHEQISRVS